MEERWSFTGNENKQMEAAQITMENKQIQFCICIKHRPESESSHAYDILNQIWHQTNVKYDTKYLNYIQI